MKKILVVGGGAAGMAASLSAALKGNSVTLLERNEKLGKKVFITGKGRCNVTNDCDIEEFLTHVVTNRKFLYSAIYGFSNTDVMEFLEKEGCPLKTERGNRVFPVSDHSSDVIKAFERALRKQHVEILLNTRVTGLRTEMETDGPVCTGVTVKTLNGPEKSIAADAVILATGGLSYASTGSTGDGLRFAEETGHKVTDTYPSLVPFVSPETFVYGLSGLSLRNIGFSVLQNGKTVFSDFGEMLFTHFGISGPVVLTASTRLTDKLNAGVETEACIDLKPALTEAMLDERILRDFKGNENKKLQNLMGGLVPKALGDAVLLKAEIPGDILVRDLRKEDRKRLVDTLKCLKIRITGTRDYNEAIVTKGGVAVSEVKVGTMESKRVKNLYFAGEMLDLDAETGGFNLQIAWSTGYLAGENA